MKSISIVICAYNSSTRLESTIKHIAELEVNQIQTELIIVNNASTDNTFDIAQNLCDKHILNFPFKTVNEPNPGLTNARLKGIEVSISDVILFCDDDNWLDKSYVQNAYNHFITHPNLAIWGAGYAEPVFEINKPQWIEPYLRMLAIFDNERDKIGDSLHNQAIVSGAGMCISRNFANIYVQCLIDNPKRKLLDRTGDTTLAGGDSDMHYIAYLNGFKTAYFMDLKFKHYMPKGRLSKQYILNLKRNMSASSVLLTHLNNGPEPKWNILGLIFYLIKSFFTNRMEFLMTIEGIKGNRLGNRIIKSIQ